MTDRYERIRAALAMGPTPGPWGLTELPKWQHTAGSEEEAILAAADHMRYRIERNSTWKAAGAAILRWLESVVARRQLALF